METPTGSRSQRRGLGAVTTLVLLVLLLLLPFSFLLSGRSRGLTALLLRSHEDQRARELAALTLEAAVHRLRQQTRRPGAPAFDFFRQALDGDELELSLPELPAVAAELERLPGYSLPAGVPVRLLRQAYVGQADVAVTAYEVFGVVRLTATVQGPGGVAATRVREYGFRRSLAAPPRPLDRPTFLLADARALLTRGALGDHANRAMRRSLDMVTALGATLEDDVRRFQELADQRPEAAPMLAPVLAAYQETLARLRRGAAAWQLCPPGTPTEAEARTLHLFHPDLAIYTTADEVVLEDLDLPTRIQPHSAAVRAGRQAVQAADAARRERIEQLLARAGAGDQGALPALTEAYHQSTRDYLAAVEDLVGRIDDLLGVYKHFQDRVEELGGEAADFLRGRFARLDEVELRRKAHFVFLGAGAPERAREFLARRPGPTGFVFVENPDQPLLLDLRAWTGRLVVAATGEIVVQAATVAAPDRDQLTLISPAGVELRGPSDAAVLVPGGRFDPAGGAARGSLVLGEIFGETATVLRGTLRRLPAVQTSEGGAGGLRPPPAPETLHVELGPYPLYRKVTR